MTFQIVIEYHKRTIRLSVEQLHIDDRSEMYKVTGSNGEITIESNRPLFRGKGLKHRVPNWKQTTGKTVSEKVLGLIGNAIGTYIEHIL